MYGHYAHELRKVSIELPRFAVLASVHRTATVSSFDPRKKVRIELQTVAVLWTLFKTAIYGRCAQVLCPLQEIPSLLHSPLPKARPEQQTEVVSRDSVHNQTATTTKI